LRPRTARRARRAVIAISILSVLSLLFVALGAPLSGGLAQTKAMRASSRSDAALAKLHPNLREQAKAAPDASVMVHAYVRAGTDLSAWMPTAVARAWVDPRGYTAVTGFVQARNLVKLASLSEIELVMPMGGAFAPADDPTAMSGPRALPSAELQDKMSGAMQNGSGASATAAGGGEFTPDGWFDVLDNHHSAAAWAKGYTGAGVKAIVNDSGIDFANPDLMGTQARVTDPSSPYFGWPEQFDQLGMILAALDYFNGTNFIATNALNGGYVDTSTVVTDGSAAYQPLDADETHAYTLTGTSLSGNYHIGTHPDGSLTQWYRIANGIDLGDPDAADERPAILVVDEAEAGVYDTVYVDLNFNFDFSDDDPARKGDEVIGADWWGAYDPAIEDFDPEPDGWYDESGGLLYWISDGVNPIPGADWYWGMGIAGNGAQDGGEPSAGNMVLFSYNTWWTSPAGNHGQLVASGIAGQGVTNDDSYDSIFGASELDQQTGGVVPSYKPADSTGIVTGAGKDVGLVDAGDFYSVGFVDAFVLAALGYDGIPGTDDDVQMINNSWGSPGLDDGWAGFDRLIDFYVRNLNPTFITFGSSGNDGPGFGSVSTPVPATGILVGASTVFGSTGWDSATSVDQITHGDIPAFSSRGPGARGDAAVDIVASGQRSSGSLAVNETFNGAHAWITWGGTSRATPVAIGNAALMLQAYRETYGSWPHQDVAEAILKSSAQDIRYDPFTMGAGLVDGNRAVDVAAGLGGGYVTPHTWEAGSWNGEEYRGFASVMRPGETDEQVFEIHNPSGSALHYDVSARWLQKQSQWETQWTSAPITEEDVTLVDDDPSATEYDWNAPHYLWDVTEQIPEDTDLLVVRHHFLRDQFDPAGAYDWTQVSDWYMMAFDWTDVNGDGNLWEDLNGNGTVNAGELDQGEYVRYDYANQRGNNGYITIHNPGDRHHDGIFIGLMHNQARADVPQTTMTLGMDFYQQVELPWVSFWGSTGVDVSAGGTQRVRARVAVPGDAPLGLYEGALVFDDGSWVTTVPVTINVTGRRAELAAGSDVAEGYYHNGRVYGGTDWRGGTAGAEWRHFYTELPEDPAGLRRLKDGSQYFLAEATWSGLPTDLNLHILGPVADDFSAQEPGYYGPYTLAELGASDTGAAGAGAFLIGSSSGGGAEFISAPYSPGLNAVFVHNVFLAGDSPTADISVRAGAMGVGTSPIDISRPSNSGTFTVTEEIVSTMDLSGLVVEGFGMSAPEVIEASVPQDDPNDPETSSYTKVLELDHAGLLDIVLDGPDADDLDLFLAYDFNGDGEFDLASEQIAASTTSTADESVSLSLPADGLYKIYVHGWSVPSNESAFTLTVNAPQGHDIVVEDAPEGGINANRGYKFDVVLDTTGRAPGTYFGVITIGPPEGPSAVVVDVAFTIRE
jgi:hypothetical protein